jgi:beta-glucosidase
VIRRTLWALLAAGAATIAAGADAPAATTDKSAAVEARVGDLLSRLTLDEKLSLIGGDREFFIRGIPRLSIPEVKMSDGPLGVRNYGPSTAYPATVGLAATWDPSLARDYGASLGKDARARGVGILLAPGVNIIRVPQNGRNFEYLSEDPYLAGVFASQIVTGIQSEGVAATVKHFAANSQETDQGTIDERISERALREIYLPAFRAAVTKGHAWAVMNAANQINGAYCTANDWLNNTVLKGEWGFEGVLMSDWSTAHDTLGAANGGLDLEMPSGQFMNPAALKALLLSGKVSQATVDDKVRRILRLEVANGFLDRSQESSSPGDDPKGAEMALRIEREAVVLLKNDANALPFVTKRMKKVVVLGPNADSYPSGGGSSRVQPFNFVSVLEGLNRDAGRRMKVESIPSSQAEFTPDQARLVQSADAAVVCVGFNQQFEREGFDRTFGLPPGQAALIRRVAALNPRTVVVINSGAAVGTADWIGGVPAVLQAWYPGQEGGRAIADILTGAVNPSGKLPISYGARVEDSASFGNFPGSNGKVDYAEGIFVGYRWFDSKGVAPLFPFGFGLSYTSFTYSKIRIDRTDDGLCSVTFSVTNNGSRDGDEISEVYVSPPVLSSVVRPVRELKGFSRVRLAFDETKTITVVLDADTFSYFDEAKKAWVVDPGSYTIEVGSSSRNIQLTAPVDVP